MQQSLSGKYVNEYLQNPPMLAKTYKERLMQIYPHIFSIDKHDPFTARGIADLIGGINPEYLTYEFISSDNAEHARKLDEQLFAIKTTEE